MKAMARRGMVASPHYLATGAGVNVLRRGGSAVDAAIATNAVLAVVTPFLCGIGGDLFAQVYTASDRTLAGLNGSGRAPKQATPERVRELAGGDTVPARGPLPITVPGCVEAWGKLHERYGRLPFRDLLADAVTYARDGFPVTASFARASQLSSAFFHPDTPACDTFLPNGESPIEGQIVVQSRIARTLQTIADEGPQAYYNGPVAEEIARAVQSVGGLLSPEDLAEHHSDWVEPLSTQYRGATIYELPPNSQGMIALQILNILQRLPEGPIRQGGADYVHLLAEAARLAHADRARHLTDPLHMSVEVSALLSDRYAEERAKLIGEEATAVALAGTPGDTIYLCAADGDGNLVSMIESNFMGFGSGVMAGETGVMLQNRGHWFSLNADDSNVIAPGKRTLHTLMPGMVFKGDNPWLIFGSMGGSTQAQIHVELLTRKIDQELPVDQTVSAPRFDAVVGINDKGYPLIQMENRFPAEVIGSIQRRGHCVQLLEPYSSAVGHAHMIEIMDNGAYAGAADPRADSLAMGY